VAPGHRSEGVGPLQQIIVILKVATPGLFYRDRGVVHQAGQLAPVLSRRRQRRVDGRILDFFAFIRFDAISTAAEAAFTLPPLWSSRE
jgi:hypothetical protein